MKPQQLLILQHTFSETSDEVVLFVDILENGIEVPPNIVFKED